MQEVIEGYALSPQQSHLWLQQRIEGRSPVFKAYCAISIKGNLEKDAFKAALHQFLSEYEIFRTSFRTLTGMKVPLQVIHENVALTWQYDDLSALGNQQQEAEVAARFQKMGSQSFDFSQNQLLNTVLLKLSQSEHVLLLHMPSLYADANSCQHIMVGIGQAYAKVNNEIEALQYVDYTEWQNELLTETEAEAGATYWRQHLSNISAVQFPFIHEEVDEKNQFNPHAFCLKLDQDCTAKIKELADTYQTSVASFLESCWRMMLWRLVGQSGNLLGRSFDNRHYEELAEAIGLFARYLPVYVPIDEGMQFHDLWQQVHTAVEEGSQWQEYFSWDQMGELLEEITSDAFLPLCFDWYDSLPPYKVDDLIMEIKQIYVCLDRFKFNLACWHQPQDQILVELHYDAGLFAAKDAQRLINQFHVLVQGALRTPEAVVDSLDMLTETEKQLFVDLNMTQVDYDLSQSIHRLFEAQVKREPDRIAVKFDDEQLTYADLNGQANQLTRHLQALDLGSAPMVMISMERSLEMLIGILGILKAGGAYVPIDPFIPQPRFAFLQKETQAAVLLTQEKFVEQLPASDMNIICLDTASHILEPYSTDNLAEDVSEESLAYIIYTSGSTGEPKGVMVPHRGVVNYLQWCTEAYHIQQGDGVPVHSSLGFDLTVTSLLAPLVVGQKVILLPEDRGLEALDEALRLENDFGLLKITPSHLGVLSQLLPAEVTKSQVGTLVIGGEALHGTALSFWQTYAPQTRLINEYGPTETVVGCAVYEITAETSGAVPIGRPIANTQLYVLDNYLRAVPIGVPGELYIGGTGLAHGYLSRPGLTAQQFVPNPFASEPGQRMYKTGDMVRYLPDGNLEFLGRNDHQVKIRGFRIELEEIDAVLKQHPGIETAVTQVQESPSVGKSLASYVVPNKDTNLSIGAVREFLQNRLPDYMVPRSLLLLDFLPLTPNGKIDREALPEPEKIRPDYLAPRTPVEEELVAIWEQLLNIEQIGIYDNFFDLGGHSLLLTQLATRIHDAFHVKVPLRILFDVPILADLTTAIAAVQLEQASTEDVSQMMAELQALSPEQVKALLESEGEE